MNSEDKMVQITFKRQSKKKILELIRLHRNEREDAGINKTAQK